MSACIALAGCASQAGTAEGRSGDEPEAFVVNPIRVAAPRPRWAEPAAPQDSDGAFAPSILVPHGERTDEVIASVGDVQIRKSDVYDRMLDNDRRAARLWVDLLVLDVVVADMAREYGITVGRSEVEALVAEEEKLLRTQVEVERGEDASFDDFLEREFGLTLDEYRSFLALDLARGRYRGLVMRYVGTREDRVEVRFIVHSDAEVLEDLRKRIVAGADVAALARQYSEDRTRVDGGRLGPFGRRFQHPIARAAFELEAGDVSAVLTFDDRGRTRHAVVYCLRRLPARDEPFANVRDELVRDLERRPITPFEQNAFVVQYCRPTSTLDSAAEGR